LRPALTAAKVLNEMYRFMALPVLFPGLRYSAHTVCSAGNLAR
jgi:hypothetical protein